MYRAVDIWIEKECFVDKNTTDTMMERKIGLMKFVEYGILNHNNNQKEGRVRGYL